MLFKAMVISTKITEKCIISPPPLIHDLWVTHILETRSYALMCKHLVCGGCTIHHSKQYSPSLENSTREGASALEMYAALFDTMPSRFVWPEFHASQQPHASFDSPVASESLSESDSFVLKSKPASGDSILAERRDGETVDAEEQDPSYASLSAAQKICVILLDGRCVNFMVDLDWSVSHLKAMIDEQSDVPEDLQRLIYNGYQLEDDRSLRSYSLCEFCPVHLVLRLHGC